MPYLIKNDPGFEGTLQKIFDRALSRLPVLLLCVGSDLAMMERLNDYDRPFHQRGTEMVVPPLGPAEVADMLGLAPAEAMDAYLITGGLPLVLEEWPEGEGHSATSPMRCGTRRPRSLSAVSARSRPSSRPMRRPGHTRRHRVGERTHTLIGRAAGGVPATSLNRALRLLVAKRVVEAVTPLSTRPSKETRYYISDPHLRFWLAFLGPNLPEIERARGTWCWTGSGSHGRHGAGGPSSR
ncbi:hypothetical protein NKH18_30310 [Streptomyces sp. M10(2022)]